MVYESGAGNLLHGENSLLSSVISLIKRILTVFYSLALFRSACKTGEVLRRLGIPRSFPTIKNQTHQGTFPGSLVSCPVRQSRSYRKGMEGGVRLLRKSPRLFCLPESTAWILGKPAWFPLITDAFPIFFLIFAAFSSEPENISCFS